MKNPIAQLSIEASNGLDWTTVGRANSVPMLRCGDLLGEKVLRLALRYGRFGVDALVLDRSIKGLDWSIEGGRLAVGGDEAERTQIVLGDFAQRPQPVQEPREMRHAVGVRANARRRRIEETAALHAVDALGHERQRAGYVA